MRVRLISLLLLCFWHLESQAVSCERAFKNRRSPDALNMTMPSLRHFAKTGGIRTREKNNPQLHLENVSVRVLSAFGFDVIQNPGNVKSPVFQSYYDSIRAREALHYKKDPDFIIEGRVFDNYSPETPHLRSVRNGIHKKVKEGQTHRIVLNLMRNEGFLSREWSLADLARELQIYDQHNLWEVIVIYGPKSSPKLISIYPELYYHNSPFHRNKLYKRAIHAIPIPSPES